MLAVALLAATICMAAEPAQAQRTTLPDTPIGRLASAWLAAFNSGDEVAMRAFNEAHVPKKDLEEQPMEARLEQFGRMSRQTGALKLIEVAGMRPARIVLLVESATGEHDCDISAGTSQDIDANGVPDDCQILSKPARRA
jgi:hypothetical protein